ncbi:cell division protein FtsK, partial [Bacillus licheniformis]
MAKRKRKSTKKQKQGKKRIHLKFELYGLICIAISIIAVLQLGVAGQTFIYMFRFFAGEWFILCLLGLFLTGLSLFWKKKTPSFLTRRKAGLYCIIASMLLLSHVQLFQHLTERGMVQSPSVIQNTWELFLMDVKGETGSPDLGGGMIGALLFAASYFLFASAGSKIIAVFLILIGLLLITDRSLQETLIKWMTPVASFMKNQWQAFLADLKQLKNSSPKKKSGKKQKTQRKPKVSEEPVQEADLDPDPVIQSEPIISSFSDRDEKPEV